MRNNKFSIEYKLAYYKMESNYETETQNVRQAAHAEKHA